jgi:hypothetical protein
MGDVAELLSRADLRRRVIEAGRSLLHALELEMKADFTLDFARIAVWIREDAKTVKKSPDGSHGVRPFP